jgi:hypothetical protein
MDDDKERGPIRRRASSASSLLAELANEAADVKGADATLARDRDAAAHRVHEALRDVFDFLVPFCEHANRIEPEVRRTYRIDNRAAYTHLQWRDAYVSARKREVADGALLDHVTFGVRLAAPEPVIITRRWDQLQTLKAELHHLHLTALDDFDVIGKPKQEWYEVRLAPEVPVLLRFQGNFGEGRIDVRSCNIDGFGITSFEIELDAVTPKVLDGVGRFLIGRSNVLPLELRRVRQPIGNLNLVAGN